MKTAKSAFSSAFSLFLIIPTAFAQTQGDQEGWRKAGQELVECSAFYRMASGELDKQGKGELADQFRGSAGRALELSQVYLPSASINKRLASAQQAHAAQAAKSGFNSLVGEYGTKCKLALEQPGQRLNYWREQTQNTDGSGY